MLIRFFYVQNTYAKYVVFVESKVGLNFRLRSQIGKRVGRLASAASSALAALGSAVHPLSKNGKNGGQHNYRSEQAGADADDGRISYASQARIVG